MRIKRQRVLEIVADGSPGGGTTAILGLCEDLVKEGSFDLAVVSQSHSYLVGSLAAGSVEVFGTDFFSSRFDFRIPWRIGRIISQWKPDLIHFHGTRSAHTLSYPPLRAINEPIVYTVHGYHFLGKREPLRSLVLSAEKRIAKRVDRMIFVSQHDRTIADNHGILKPFRGKSAVVYNGIDPIELDRVPPGAPSYDLIFASRMHRQKNPLFMIEVMKALKGSGIKLLMVGGGELEERVKSQAREAGVGEDISFTGALSRCETLAAIRSAKLFILPSLWEGMPIVLMEALYYGRPIVASCIKGTDEVVRDGVTGILVKQFDPEVYVSVIKKLLNDHGLRARMSAAGQTDAEQRFVRRRTTAAHLSIYRSVLTGEGELLPSD